MATIEGSFITMPSPRTYTRVLAVARTLSNMMVRSRLVATLSGRAATVFRVYHRSASAYKIPCVSKKMASIGPPGGSLSPARPPRQSFRLFESARRSHGRTNGAELWQHGAVLTAKTMDDIESWFERGV